MPFYNTEQLIKYFDALLQKNVTIATWEWLNEKINHFKGEKGSTVFCTAFTAVPRYTGKVILSFNKDDLDQKKDMGCEFSITNYSVDRLARVWLLLHWPSENKTVYLTTITQLFKAAEMNELVALYGALPLLIYPEEWIKQCTEGIRSNIGTVLEAIMLNNSYPADHLNEPAWNQLVLKAFFNEKPVNRIIGLDKRANQTLAHILFDYADERRAAQRTIDPQLWRLAGKFIDEHTYPDIKNAFDKGSAGEKEAIALACYESKFAPALTLLGSTPQLELAIQNNKLNWEYIAVK